MTTKLTYSVAEVCELLGISSGSFYELMHTKQLTTIKILKRRMVTHDDLMEFMDQARDAA